MVAIGLFFPLGKIAGIVLNSEAGDPTIMEDVEVPDRFDILEGTPYDKMGYPMDHFEQYRPFTCPRCGSSINSRYSRLMVPAGQSSDLSGDLLIRPVEVFTCLQCNMVSYEVISTMRNS